MRLYIIRHAEPAYPDDALTPRGHAQAVALAARFATAGLDSIACSPMRRALDTARPIAERLGLPLAVEPWAAELESWFIDQPPQGETPAWQVAAAAVRSASPPVGHADWHALPPLAPATLEERFAMLVRDADGFLARHGRVRVGALYCPEPGGGKLRPYPGWDRAGWSEASSDPPRPCPAGDGAGRAEASSAPAPDASPTTGSTSLPPGRGRVGEGGRPGGGRPASARLALVCHQGLALTWLAHLLAIPVPLVWAGFALPPSSVTTIDFEPAGDGLEAPRCHGLGDLSHLA